MGNSESEGFMIHGFFIGIGITIIYYAGIITEFTRKGGSYDLAQELKSRKSWSNND